MDGDQFTISEIEYQSVLQAKGLIFIKSLGVTINTSRIESIYPVSMADTLQDRKQQQTGVLHDGTKVKRHFGEWVDMFTQVPDDNGNYRPVKLDPTYYPEIARDCVPTEQEFEKLRELPTDQRLAIILQGTVEPRKIESEMNSIKDLLV